MVDDDERTLHNRAYFFSAASTAMRNILIAMEYAKPGEKQVAQAQ